MNIWRVITYLTTLAVIAGALAYALTSWSPRVSHVQVELVALRAPSELVAGEEAVVQTELRFDRPGDYLVRLEVCADSCEAIRWGVPVGDALAWSGELARWQPAPGSYVALLRVWERFEGVFFRTVLEHRWPLNVYAP